MAEISFASLSPSLLARKGGAKPAMRPQHAALASIPSIAPEADADKLEDLGWNDMGDGDDTAAPHMGSAEIFALTPMAGPDEVSAEPEVLRQREAIAERIAPRPAPAAPKTVTTKSPRARKDRAAFTLRLDQQRHVKLRLACTMRDTSAQALVTEALDAFLGTMPELEALAAQVKPR
ncbi:hypothetical protein [Tsuneonella amylolytica]|uniref:hypothetical protein n=1 Tax=Tsuneonella amylolytica TaxID=2338327 RepID=UPI000EA89C1A|nr:hypothetical protein [Tsuneonella amylolytica]